MRLPEHDSLDSLSSELEMGSLLHSPAEQATTPFHRSSESRCAILLYAPLSLKLKTGWRSSLLRRTLHSSRLLMLIAGVRGVSLTTSYTREVRIRRRYYSDLIIKA